MHRITATGLAALLAAVAGAQEMDGQRIEVKAGETATRFVPVSVSYDGPAPETAVDVIEEATGKAYPATVRDGELVFVPEALAAGSETAFVVKVLPEKRAPRVEIRPKGDDPILEVWIDGELFTAYHYGVGRELTFEEARAKIPDLTERQFKRLDTDGDGKLEGADASAADDREVKKTLAGLVHRKPFLWPVHGEGQVTVTRNWPMGPAEDETDHEHQKSMWTAHGDVNGADLWSETWANSGYEMVEEVDSGSGDAYGWIRSKQTWQTKDHEPVVTEVREYRFYATPPSNRVFDTALTFTADYGDAVFGDTKEGGLFSFRIRPEIQEKGGTGVITTAVGQGEKDVWGKPSPWSDYSGEIKGVGVRGIAVLDHPSNPLHPVRWHIRSYGLNGANNFGLHDFLGDENQDGSWTIKSGDSAVFRYRAVIHSGDVNEAGIPERFENYAHPPAAAWAD